MISVEAANLIAQVYPVFVLLVVLEESRIRQSRPLHTLRDAVSVLLRSIVVVLVVLGSLASTLICVVSVAQDEPVRDVSALAVTLSGFGLFIIVMLFLVNLMTADLWRRLQDGDWWKLRISRRRAAGQAAKE